MLVREARRILIRGRENWGLLVKGYRWMVREYLPAVAFMENRDVGKDRPWLAAAYSNLGDVHDFLDAPRAAIRWYRKALRLEPDSAWDWRELGSVLHDVGQYPAAVRAFRKAAKLDPEHGWDRIEETERDAKERARPAYANGTIVFGAIAPPFWDAVEEVARGRAREALRLLKGKRTSPLRRARARAYGALGDDEGQLREWEAIAQGTGKVHIHKGDWFYMTKTVGDSPRLCRAFLKIGTRWRYGVDQIFRG